MHSAIASIVPCQQGEFINVWKNNLVAEFHTIRQLIREYPCVAMDTEFPGVVAWPRGEFRTQSEYQYQLTKCNVDLLKIIQLGITFFDADGNKPENGPCTWQFNFKFNLDSEMFAPDSIELLTNSGMDFKRHNQEGIDANDFAELLISSGLILMDNVTWITFHSGYDFGYLLSILSGQNLPNDETEFMELLKLYFPRAYDVKYIMKSCKNLKGGLQEVADTLELERVGEMHQAGSDSNLTGAAFFRMKQMFFDGEIDDAKFNGHVYGMGPAINTTTATTTATTTTTTATTTTTTTSASIENVTITTSSSSDIV